jgi:hypothetical protein
MGHSRGPDQVIGKRIAHVVVADQGRRPKRRVYLVFDDGTSFEFYGEHFQWCRGIDRDGLEAILRWLAHEGITEVMQFDGTDETAEELQSSSPP